MRCSPSARVLVSLALIGSLALPSCKRKHVAPAPLPADPSAEAPPESVDALRDLCRTLAVRIKPRPRGSSADAPAPASVPAVGAVDEPKTRLDALKAVQALEERLARDPRNAELHFQLGRVYLRVLSNPTAAEEHLCRAVLEAPDREVYRRMAREAWLSPEHEATLERSLSPVDQRLEWREHVAEARRLQAADGLERVVAFEDGLAAQRLIRSVNRARRQRTHVTVDDLATVLGGIVATPDALVVVTVAAPARTRLAALRDRTRAPAALWPGVAFGGRAMAFGRGPPAVAAIGPLVAKELRGLPIVVHAGTPTRHLHLVGRVDSAGKLTLRSASAEPFDAIPEALLVPKNR